MHFGTKSYLKNTRNHTAKHALKVIHEETNWKETSQSNNLNF
jgi:hypothetical protein